MRVPWVRRGAFHIGTNAVLSKFPSSHDGLYLAGIFFQFTTAILNNISKDLKQIPLWLFDIYSSSVLPLLRPLLSLCASRLMPFTHKFLDLTDLEWDTYEILKSYIFSYSKLVYSNCRVTEINIRGVYMYLGDKYF